MNTKYETLTIATGGHVMSLSEVALAKFPSQCDAIYAFISKDFKFQAEVEAPREASDGGDAEK